MQTSGPVRKNVDFHQDNDFGEIVHYSGNFYEAVVGGKRCLLKMARYAGTQAKILLQREYDISCRLQHPFVLSPLRFIDTHRGPAIVMEYIDGCTLTEFLNKKPSYSVRKRLLNEIFEAVEYLHMKGILHNDLKTDNILVDSVGGHIKIIDFGLAEKASEHLTKRLGGTVGYTAPEVLKGDTSLPSTCASDIYSLGRIISVMFPGRFKLVTWKCLKESPEKRYQSVAAVRRALEFVNIGKLLLLVCLLCVMIVSFVRGCAPDMQIAEIVEPPKVETPVAEPKKESCNLSGLKFKISKATCDEYAMVNGERGIKLGFKLKVSKSADTTVRVVIPLFSAKTQPFPSVDKNYTYRSQGAILGEIDLKQKKQELSFFIPFKSMPHMPDFPNDFWTQFREWIGVLSYAIQFRVLLIDEDDTAFYQSDMMIVNFDRLADYDMIYK